MTDIRLTDEQWTKIRDFIIQDPNAYLGHDEETCRNFVEAVTWVSRSGAQWRLLPEKYGKWSIYSRIHENRGSGEKIEDRMSKTEQACRRALSRMESRLA